MKCFSRIWLAKQKIFTQCGKCLACRINRISTWKLRLVNEIDSHRWTVVATLTYDEENCPENYGLRPEDVTKYIKRLRKTINGNEKEFLDKKKKIKNPKFRKIKYYYCGEYGDRYDRPHYHIILYGMNFNDKRLIEDSWGMGKVEVDKPDVEYIGYVAGYINKKIIGKKETYIYEKLQGRKAPYQRASQGIGEEWALKNREMIEEQKKIRLGQKDFPVPRYYRKKLDIKGRVYEKDMDKRETELYGKLLERVGLQKDKKTIDEFKSYCYNSRMSKVRYKDIGDLYIIDPKLERPFNLALEILQKIQERQETAIRNKQKLDNQVRGVL